MDINEYYSSLANDPAFRLQNATKNKPAPTGTDTSLMWSSASPNYGFYGSGGNWQEVNDASLSDPTIAKAVANAAHNPSMGASSGFWNEMGNKIPEGVGLEPYETGSLMSGIGTKFSVAPDVGGEEELAKKLNLMWQPVEATQLPK